MKPGPNLYPEILVVDGRSIITGWNFTAPEKTELPYPARIVDWEEEPLGISPFAPKQVVGSVLI